MLEAVIFDMDGVIVDSESGFLRSKQQLLQELGVEVDMSYHYDYFGTTSEFTWTKMKKEFAIDRSVQDLIQRANEIREEIISREGIRPIPGVLDLIKHLHSHGVRLGVASSSPLHDIIQTVEAFQCREYFLAFASGCDCENSKPFPDVFLKTADQLGVDPKDCLVIEDSTNGTKAAKAANMTCVGFRNPDYPPQDLSRADLVVDHFQELNIDICRQLF